MDDSVLLYAIVIPSCKCSPPVAKHSPHLPIQITENTTFYDIFEWIASHPFFGRNKNISHNMQDIGSSIKIIQMNFIEKKDLIESVIDIQLHTGASYRLYISPSPGDRKFVVTERMQNSCGSCGINILPSTNYFGFSSMFTTYNSIAPTTNLRSNSIITSHFKRNSLSIQEVNHINNHPRQYYTIPDPVNNHLDNNKTSTKSKNFKPVKQFIKDTKRHQQKINNGVVFKNNRR